MAIDVGDDLDNYLQKLPDPSQLVTPEAILNALRELEAEEARIDDELAASMADRDSLDTLLDRIDSVRPVVEQVQLEAAELARRVEDTAIVAERISGKVRQLDLEQSRVSDSIQMVQAVQDLKTSLAALAVSVDKKDWETATRNMQRAMTVDHDVTSSAFAEAVVPTGELPQTPTQAIQDFRDVLLSTFLREFAKASSERDEVNTSRYFKLFPMIAAETEGLDAYATFVCSIVNSRTQTTAGQASTSSTFFAAALSPLFEQIALIVSQHQPVVEKYYGQGRMLPVAVRLQQVCDRQAGEILQRWEEERSTLRKLNEVQRWRYPHLAALNQINNQTALPQQQGLAQVAAVAARKLPYQQLARQATASPAPPQQEEDESVDPKDIDGLLTEMSLISGRWSLYRRFLYGRLRQPPPPPTTSHMLQASPALHGSPDTSSLAITGVANAQQMSLLPGFNATNSELDEELEMVEKSAFQASLHRQLASVYEPLETWYLRSSIEKAHHLDEADFYNKPYLSSALDDSFFILKKVLQRLVATASLPTLQRMCSEIISIMTRDFSEILRKRMDSVWQSIQSTAQIARSKEEAQARQQFIVYANDLDTAANYLARVIDELVDGEALKQAFFRPLEFQPAVGALSDVKNTQDRFRATLKTSLDQLFNQLIRPRLRSMLADCYRDVSYVLDEDGYSDAEYQDAVRKRFLKQWDGLVEPYKDSFTTNNYQLIFTLIIGVLSRLWEIQVKSMKFTELGALGFERDLRNITAFLSSQTTFGVSVLRDSFSRLHQMAKLLSIESPSDADDLAASSGWKLSQQEMVNLLNLRT